jgi:ribokinase
MSVLVVGSFMMDCVTRTAKIPASGETVLGISYQRFLGGKGANQAVAARRLGSDVILAGKLGPDDYAEAFISLFISENIDISHVLRGTQSTGVGSIVLDTIGQNRIIIIPGANLEYSIADLLTIENDFDSASVVMAQLEVPMETTEMIAKLCVKHNKPFILNPAPAQPLSKELLSAVTYLTPNETELCFLTGVAQVNTKEEVVIAARILLSKGVKNVIVTLGEKGSMLINESGVFSFNAFDVQVVDTVAAGDSFNGALAYGIDCGMNLDASLRFASAVGALTVQKLGAIPSLPTYAEVVRFLLEHPRPDSDNV